jgi:hypothetical protein
VRSLIYLLAVVNSVLAGIGVWAVVRPPQTDVVFTSWWPERIGAAAILVLVPGVAVVALLQPANRVLRWTALALNAALVVMGTLVVAETGGLRADYLPLALGIVPVLTLAALWRNRPRRTE